MGTCVDTIDGEDLEEHGTNNVKQQQVAPDP
jgi:hypothetical protein